MRGIVGLIMHNAAKRLTRKRIALTQRVGRQIGRIGVIIITLFLALELRPTGGQPEPDEYIEVVRISLDEALAMTRDGRITDAKTMCGLMLAREHISTHRLREVHS